MQEIEIPPRDRYLHYIQLPKDHNVISWTFSTHKRSIGFGLFKQVLKTPSNPVQELGADSVHPTLSHNLLDVKGNKSTKKTISLSAWPSRDGNGSHNCSTEDLSRAISHSKLEETTSKLGEELSVPRTPIKNGSFMSRSTSACDFEEILPLKNYVASKAKVKGEYKVKDPGVYILYFDNVHSWNTSKRLTFFVTTHKDVEQVSQALPTISGWILKKKRKKMQGWAKRWCVIKEGSLSYAKDESSVIRGSIHLPHSVVTFDYDALLVIIDSGSSLFRFKFLNDTDFQNWEQILMYYLQNGLETLDAKPERLEEGLEEIPESDVEVSLAIPRIPASTINSKNTTNSSPPTKPTSSKIKDIELVFNELLMTFEQLAKFIEPSVKPEEPNCDNLKSDSSRETKDGKKKFSSFRQKREGAASSTLSLNSDSPESARNFLSEFYKNRDSLKALLAEEIQHQTQLETAYQKAISELNGLKTTFEPLPTNSTEPFVSFQPDVAFATRRSARGRCSVYGRRQNSIVSISTIGNDDFFDAAEELEGQVGSFSSQEDVSEPEDMICEDTDSDTDVVVPLSPVATPQSLQESLSKPNKLITFPSPDIVPRRTKLPSPICGEEVSFLGILRKNVGKDLATISLPISLNEPLNILQRMCEELEYCELLTQANQLSDSLERLIYVTAFALSPYAATGFRAARKPFNPLLGETYECVRPDKGFLFISEKVSHSPPIFACHAESNDYVFWQDSKPKSKFWGKSMELLAPGTIHVVLKSTSEHFTFTKAVGCMRNLVAGERYLEYSGDVIIKNHSTGEFCKVTFKESSFFSSSNNEFKATVHDKTGSVVHHLEGQWNHSIVWKKPDQQIIWQPHPLPPHAAKMYSFTQFAMELNELTPDLEGYLPPTDTRLRPDQTLFEHGDVAAAEKEKIRVEENQRIRRRDREANGLTYDPTWFHLTPQIDHEGNTIESWTFKGDYWAARKARDFGNVPSLW